MMKLTTMLRYYYIVALIVQFHSMGFVEFPNIIAGMHLLHPNYEFKKKLPKNALINTLFSSSRVITEFSNRLLGIRT